MDIVFAWDAASDGAPPGGNQRYVLEMGTPSHMLLKAVSLPAVMTEDTTEAATGMSADLEDEEVADGEEAGEEDTTMVDTTVIGTVIEAEVNMMMSMADVEGGADEVADMEVGMAEIDTIAEVAADMAYLPGPPAPLHLHLHRPTWHMGTVQATQLARMGLHPFQRLLL
jgi:hypothetical protein